MDNTTTTTMAPAETEKTHVEITDKNCNFFGKVLKVIEKDADYVLAEIKVGEKYVEHLFTTSQTNAVVAPSTAATTVA